LCCSSCRKVPTQDVKLMKCSACKSSQYCNTLCQKAHWPTHKISCEEKNLFRIAMEKRRLSAAASEVEELTSGLVIDMPGMVEDRKVAALTTPEVIDLMEPSDLEMMSSSNDDRKIAAPIEVIDLTGDYEEYTKVDGFDSEIAEVEDDRKIAAPLSDVSSNEVLQEKDKEIERLKSENSQIKESVSEMNECIICLNGRKSVLLLPCKHICLCDRCAVDVSVCPICRMGVKDQMGGLFYS